MRDAGEIRRAMRAQPFQPFQIVMVNGASYTVGHPDFIYIPPGDRPRKVICFIPADGRGYDERHIDLALIQEVVIPGQDAATESAAESGS
jgi:hypothetical protein